MILKKLLKNIKIPITLAFTDYNYGKLYSQEYSYKDFKNINKELLKMEAMETNLEGCCMEVRVK